MKKLMFGKIVAFFQLIRWYNLLIAAGVFYFTRWFLVEAFLSMEKVHSPFNEWTFLWLVVNYLLIMAGGYALNDYYDVGMDEINRTDKTILRRKLPIETGIRTFFVLVSIGLLSALGQAIVIREKYLFIFPVFVAGLLWFYSTKFKRDFFWGNFSIALLAFLNVFLIFLHYMMLFPIVKDIPTYVYPVIFKLTFLYACLAAIVSFIREVVKDMLDIKGDKEFGCKNFPIVWGVKKTKHFLLVLEVIFLLFLAFMVYFLSGFRSHYVFLFFVVVLVPFWIFVIRETWSAKEEKDFKQLALLLKIYMIAGILSMQLIPESWA